MRPFSFGFLGSLAAHVVLALLLLLLFRHESHAKGGGGEDGHTGSGDTAIDVSLAAPSPAATAAPADPTPADRDTPSDDPAPLRDTTTAPLVRTPRPALPALPHENAANGSDEATNGGRRPLPRRIGIGDGLVDGDSVDGQRSLLPKAVVCKDPVAGKWEALKFSPIRGDWVHFVLDVHREGSFLRGTILSHTWLGSPQDIAPPVCALGGFEMTVSMNATGRVSGDGITFEASAFTIVSEPCPQPSYTYAPDHFGGTIDASRQEFQSVNNDGYNEFNAPYVFRRTGCLDE